MVERRRVRAVFNEFEKEINLLQRFNSRNNSIYFGGAGRPSAARISGHQMCLMTESIFHRAFSKLEDFFEQTFLMYCRGKPTASNRPVISYLRPIDTAHARNMMKSSMRFLEWNNSENLIDRSDLYLDNGNPFRVSITSKRVMLDNARKIRNAIAHRSDEADRQFQNVLVSSLGVMPLKKPAPGEFLILANPADAPNQYLQTYLKDFLEVARLAADV